MPGDLAARGPALLSGEPRRFVVLAAPRTGSNWLCSLLDSHPDATCHHELFNTEGIHLALSCRGKLDLGPIEQRDEDPAAFLAAMWGATLETTGPQRALGFKLNRGHTPAAFRAAFGDPGLRAIVLRRRNRLRTFLSERIAEATGEWESYPGRPVRSEPLCVEVRAPEVLAHAAANQAYYQWLDAALRAAGQPRCDVAYEELDDPATHGRLLAFLGLEDRPLFGQTRRQGARDLCQSIRNFAQLAEELAATPLAGDLQA